MLSEIPLRLRFVYALLTKLTIRHDVYHVSETELPRAGVYGSQLSYCDLHSVTVFTCQLPVSATKIRLENSKQKKNQM